MFKRTIPWTEATVNFWRGCDKVSPGCKFCYMHRDMPKFGMNPEVVVRTNDDTFYKALSWEKPTLIFTCSWSDFFHKEADEWRADAWDVIRRTPQHTWQILTKRPERIKECLPLDWGNGWDHVWLGVSIETNAYLHRAVTLSEVPANVRFISAEPLLEEVDFVGGSTGEIILKHFHQIIIGGESGYSSGEYRYRKCKLSWIERAIWDMEETPVSVFVKQLGTYLAKGMKLRDWKGEDPAEWPKLFHVRQYPKGYNKQMLEEIK